MAHPKHTAGPWRHIAETKPQAGRHWHCIEAEVDLGDDTLSWVTIGEFYDHTGPLMNTPDAEIAANARLAAAAPDMLAALKRASTDDSMGFGNCPGCGAIAACEQAHESDCYIAAAIAKAEGRT